MFSAFLADAIHNHGQMSSRPEFFSGRGATLSDLNDRILENLYRRILGNHELGEKAAQAFVDMVADIPVLSATDFLITLSALEGNGWVWEKCLLGNQKGIYAGDVGSGLGTILSVAGGSRERNETPAIRNEFLRRHGKKIKPQWVQCANGAFMDVNSTYGDYRSFPDEDEG
jgi:hypothetical protein